MHAMSVLLLHIYVNYESINPNIYVQCVAMRVVEDKVKV